MAYINHFQHDIFISYSRIDNLTPSETEKGWIDQFLSILRVKLSKHIGKFDAVRIWRDDRIDGNELFDDVIKDSISHAAIFLAFTSNGYLNSEYCQNELAWFYNKAQSEDIGLDVGSRRRIVNILLYNIPYEQWPEAYGRAAGFKFYDADQPEDLGEPCDISSRMFKSQLRKLVTALVELIKVMSPPASDAPSADKLIETQYDVYLAEVTDSLRRQKRRLIQKFELDGLTVSRNIPPPHEVQQHEEAVIDALNRSTLCVHMLDHLGGAEIKGEINMTYPRKQVTLGLQHAQAQLIWTPRDLDFESIEDEQQKKFLEGLENPTTEEKSYDFLRVPADELYRIVLEMIDEIKSADAPQALRAALIDTHEKDESFVLDITGSLIKKGIIPYINPIVDDPRSSIDSLKNRLKRVNAVVILFGQVGAEWVIARLEEMIKIVISEKLPIKSFCIYLAKPHRRAEDIHSKYPYLNTRLLDNQHGFNPSSLQPLFNDLGVEGT